MRPEPHASGELARKASAGPAPDREQHASITSKQYIASFPSGQSHPNQFLDASTYEKLHQVLTLPVSQTCRVGHLKDQVEHFTGSPVALASSLSRRAVADAYQAHEHAVWPPRVSTFSFRQTSVIQLKISHSSNG